MLVVAGLRALVRPLRVGQRARPGAPKAAAGPAPAARLLPSPPTRSAGTLRRRFRRSARALGVWAGRCEVVTVGSTMDAHSPKSMRVRMGAKSAVAGSSLQPDHRAEDGGGDHEQRVAACHRGHGVEHGEDQTWMRPLPPRRQCAVARWPLQVRPRIATGTTGSSRTARSPARPSGDHGKSVRP